MDNDGVLKMRGELMRKINVLFICHERDINGATRSMLDLISVLKEKYNFYVLLRFDNGEVFDEIKRRKIQYFYCPYKWWKTTCTKGKYHIVARRIKWRFQWKKQNEMYAEQVAEKLEPYKIDIIHTNSSVTNFGAELSRKLGCKHIWHIREFGIEDFSTYPLVSKKEYYGEINNGSDKVVVISEALKEKYKKNVSSNKLVRIYNGVSKNNLYEKTNYNYSAPLTILQSGAISKAKGQDIAIKAISILNQKGIKVRLLLAGSGNIEELGIQKREILDNVVFLGKVSNLPEIRKKVDIEIVCSKCEAFGRVTVEAMMSSLLVVGSKSGGTPELVKENETGLLFESGNAIQLADRIEQVDKQRDILKKYGNRAYCEAKEFFSIERCATEIDRLYQEVMR